MSFNKTASATGSAYAQDGTTTGSLVTSSSTATASSEISESDAYNSASAIASAVAQSVANNNANIIDQAVDIVQGYSPVTFGINAGFTGQGISSIAIGDSAGYTRQGNYAVAIGIQAGYTGQGYQSVSIGSGAGSTEQGDSSVAIGINAGELRQGIDSVAVGHGSGRDIQGTESVAIGLYAAKYNQGDYSVAIGSNAGYTGQGDFCVAIGNNAGNTGQAKNSIILNALDTGLNTGESGFFVKPINSSIDTVALVYNPGTGRITYNNTTGAKTFVIDHPVNPEKYLVHACLEGPEAGVYYRGEGTIFNNHSVEIVLPDYVDKLANDFTVQVTPIYDPSITKPLLTSRVVNNKFTVYGENCAFFWSVHGKRGSIEVEPTKSSVDVKGSGPYLWI
jgi:hypothetical protein